jgi:hypothetical protein
MSLKPPALVRDGTYYGSNCWSNRSAQGFFLRKIELPVHLFYVGTLSLTARYQCRRHLLGILGTAKSVGMGEVSPNVYSRSLRQNQIEIHLWHTSPDSPALSRARSARQFRFGLKPILRFQILQLCSFSRYAFFQSFFIVRWTERKLRLQRIDDEALISNRAARTISDFFFGRHEPRQPRVLLQSLRRSQRLLSK